jgi:hypothetical protein
MRRQANEQDFQRLRTAMLGTFVVAELRHRIETNQLPESYKVHAFQIVFPPDAAPEVRLNDEVRGAVRWRSRREKPMDTFKGGVWVPETQFGSLCSALTGSADGHLVSVLTLSTTPRADRVALPVGGRQRGRDSCLAARVGGAAPAGWSAELPAG